MLIEYGCLLVAATTLGQADDAVELRWKFEKGQTFRVRTIEKQTQILKLKKPIFHQNTLTVVARFTVADADVKGAVLDYKIESAKLNTDSPTTIDKQLTKRMAGSRFRITLTACGRVSRLDGFEAFLTRLSDGDAKVRQTAQALLNKKTMKRSLSDLFCCLPRKKVSKGDTWQRQGVLTLGPLGFFKTTESYTFTGKDGDVCRIRSRAKLDYTLPQSKTTGIKLVGGDLRAKTASNEFLFNAALGRISRRTTKLEIEGKLVVEVAKMKIPTQLKLVRTIEHRLEPVMKD